jgi:hypothetical protein
MRVSFDKTKWRISSEVQNFLHTYDQKKWRMVVVQDLYDGAITAHNFQHHDELCNLKWPIALPLLAPNSFSTTFTITATFLSDLPVASSKESLRESLLHFRWPAKAFARWFQMTESEQSLLLCLIYVLAEIVHMANLPRFSLSMPLPF